MLKGLVKLIFIAISIFEGSAMDTFDKTVQPILDSLPF